MSVPSIVAVTMPKWGIEMTEGTVNAWTVAVGQSVVKGDPLLDVETEKIVNTVESPGAGILRRQLVQPTEVRSVGALIGVIADALVSEADIDAFVAGFRAESVSFEPDALAAQVASSGGGDRTAPATATPGESRVSPIARKLAEKLGIDLSQVPGTGRNGRVSKEDVEAYAARQGAALGTQGAAAAEVASVEPSPPVLSAAPRALADSPQARRLPMSGMRATIARRLLDSYQNLPHYRLACDADVGRLILKKGEISDHAHTRISVNDMLVRACSLALLRHPVLNAQLVGNEILQFEHADVGVAVATDSGLVTPIVRRADTKNVAQIARETADLAERAQQSRLTREEITGGSFTISNLGMYGIERFDAIINPPQVAILAVGAAQERVIARDGRAVVASMMTLTLSADHRVVDGAAAAAFMATLRRLIEQPDDL